MPDLRRLRAFVAVAEEQSFTRAAARLHLAQQAVSKSVAALEAELGVELLHRTTHEVRLTPAGAALLASGRDVLLAAEAAWEEARAVGRGLAGTVRIGVTPAVGPRAVAQAVRVLRDGATGTAVSVHEVRPGDVERGLRERALDVVLARTAPAAPGVDSRPLRSTAAALLVPRDHPLAAAGPVDPAALDGERLLVWSPPGTPYTDLLLARLAAAGARPAPVESRVTGVGPQTDLAAEGAVALVPEGWPTDEDTVTVPLAVPIELPLLVLWAAGRPGPAVRRLLAAPRTSADT